MSRDEKRTVVSRLRSTATVVAVLRELADGPLSFVTRDELTRLADAIEKGGR